MEPVEAADGQESAIGPLTWRLPLRISSGPPPLSTHAASPVLPPAQDPLPLNIAQQAAEEPASQQTTRKGRLGSLSGQQRQERLDQSAAVAASEELRAAAVAACAKDWATRSGNSPADVVLLKDAHRLAPRGLCLELQRLAVPYPACYCLEK